MYIKSNSIVAIESGDFCNNDVVKLLEFSYQSNKLTSHIPANFLTEPCMIIIKMSKTGSLLFKKNYE